MSKFARIKISVVRGVCRNKKINIATNYTNLHE
jgi:hypothetical protein